MENNRVNKVAQGATLNEFGDVYVFSQKVSCEGNLSSSTHPKIFLKIPDVEEGKKESKVHCPYCKQVFIYKKSNENK